VNARKMPAYRRVLFRSSAGCGECLEILKSVGRSHPAVFEKNLKPGEIGLQLEIG